MIYGLGGGRGTLAPLQSQAGAQRYVFTERQLQGAINDAVSAHRLTVGGTSGNVVPFRIVIAWTIPISRTIVIPPQCLGLLITGASRGAKLLVATDIGSVFDVRADYVTIRDLDVQGTTAAAAGVDLITVTQEVDELNIVNVDCNFLGEYLVVSGSGLLASAYVAGGAALSGSSGLNISEASGCYFGALRLSGGIVLSEGAGNKFIGIEAPDGTCDTSATSAGGNTVAMCRFSASPTTHAGDAVGLNL